MARLKIKEIAESQGLNASQLARRADMSLPPIYRIWNDPHATITTATLTRLAKALGVSIHDLIDDNDEETNSRGGLCFSLGSRTA